MRLHRVMIHVKDMGRMTAFYENILRIKLIDETRMENWSEF